MLIKEAVWEECKSCGVKRRMISEEIYGCDSCKRKIDFPGKGGKRHHDYLRLSVFYNADRSAEHFHFCSWKCVLKKLPKIKSDSFIALPYLHYDEAVKGQHAKDFLKLIGKNL